MPKPVVGLAGFAVLLFRMIVDHALLSIKTVFSTNKFDAIAGGQIRLNCQESSGLGGDAETHLRLKQHSDGLSIAPGW